KEYGLPHLLPLVRGAFNRLPRRIGRRLSWVATRLGLAHPDDYLSGVALTTPSVARSLLQRPAHGVRDYGRVRECFVAAQARGPLDTVLGGDVLSYLLDDILVKVDRTTMGNSLEARAPLLDHELAEFAARLPESFKLRGATGKYL